MGLLVKGLPYKQRTIQSIEISGPIQADQTGKRWC